MRTIGSHFPDETLFESFTFPFFDFKYQANHKKIAEAFMSVPDADGVVGRRGLYVHIPFCETICQFCPFSKSVGNKERISRYLDALRIEMKTVGQSDRAQSWQLGAVYIGGGTPSVLSPQQAYDLLYQIRREFNVSPSAEITFEVEAKSATDELLRAVADAGATRISFGIQSLNDELRRIVNLTAKNEEIERTINYGRKLFSDVNVDMIVGFPGQNVEDALKDVQDATLLGASSISLYPMDYATVLPKLLDKMRSGKLPLPASVSDRWEMFHKSRSLLRENLCEQNMYCFGEKGLDPCQYMFSILYGGYFDSYIGLGSSAYTSMPGIMFHNQVAEDDYVTACLSGKSAVQRSSPGHAYEKSLVYFPKRLTTDLSEAYSLGLEDFYSSRVNFLEEKGWAKVNGSTLNLTESGKLQYHRLMVGFMTELQRRIYDGSCDRLSTQLGLRADGSLTATASTVRGMGTVTSLAAKTSHKDSHV